jgi:REP element-mobilizing transposase RayT
LAELDVHVSRKPRLELEGGIHHVYARGVEQRLVYRDDEDRRTYLRELGEVIRETHWRCLSYCLMDNHLHLLVETPKANLGSGMRLLHGAYARAFNDRHGRVGHLFQGRFGSVLITTQAQLWAVIAYIVRNPVDAGLCDRADQWQWSSHAAVLGGPRPPWLAVDRLLSHCAGFGGDALGAYKRLTENLAPGDSSQSLRPFGV